MKIVSIGSGNVATHLCRALHRAGHEIAQVYSKTMTNAETLAAAFPNCAATDDLREVIASAELYVLSIKDSILQNVVDDLSQHEAADRALWVHTAGSMPVDIFSKRMKRYGVFYPLQTFSKQRDVEFAKIPFFVESPSATDESVLLQLASELTENEPLRLSSEQRRVMHVAAVFACNFTNHMYSLATELLEEADIPREVLLPLIAETASKVQTLAPKEAQTGPAMRYDTNVIDKHLSLIGDPKVRELYESISKSIYQKTQQQTK